VTVWQGAYIDAIQFHYDQPLGNLTFGSAAGEPQPKWHIPAGEYLTEVTVYHADNEFHGCRFKTSGGTESPLYGTVPSSGNRGTRRLGTLSGYHIVGLSGPGQGHGFNCGAFTCVPRVQRPARIQDL
jgi:hypothetical protein